MIPDLFLSIFAPAVARHFGLSKAGLGLLLSAGAWGGLAGTGAFLLMARRPADERRLRGCMGVMAIFALAAALAPAPLFLMAAVAGVCGGFAVADITACALLPVLVPGAPRRVLAAKFACFSLVGIAAPLAGGVLLSWSDGRAAMAVLRSAYGLTAMVMLAGVVLLSRRPPAGTGAVPPALRGGRAVWLLPVLLAALHGGTDSALARWVPAFFGEAFGTPLFPPGWILSGYALSYFLGRGLLAFLPEGRGERVLLIVPGLAGGGLLLAGLMCRSFGAAAAFYVGASFLYGLEYPVLLGMLARQQPAHLGRAIALGGLAGYALYGALSVLIGAAAEHAGDLRAALLICPFGFIAFSFVAMYWTKGKTCVP